MIEVSNISSHGFWLFDGEREYFLPYREFPWFENRTVKEITMIESYPGGHLYWPLIDVDLTLEMIEHPEKYPLRAQTA